MINKSEPLSRSLFLLSLLIASPSSWASSQSSNITGYLDMYYQYNFNQPNAVSAPTDTALAQPGANNRYRTFDQFHDAVSISLVELEIRQRQQHIEAAIDLGFGHTVDVLSPRDEVSKHLLQGYLTISPQQCDRLSISVGKMYTHMGYEVVKSQNNWNYSRSTLFGYAIPFWHVGAAIKYAIVPETVNAGVFLYNENAGLYEINRGKSLGAQLQGAASDKVQWTYNGLTGPEISSDGVSHTRTVHEGIVVYKVSSQWELASDIVFGQLSRARANNRRHAQWLAWSAFAKRRWERLSISPRFEVYTDRSGATVETSTATKPALPQRLTSSTVTFAWNLGDGLESRFEVRHDQSSSSVFSTHSGNLRKTQSSATLALMYSF